MKLKAERMKERCNVNLGDGQVMGMLVRGAVDICALRMHGSMAKKSVRLY